MRLELSPAASPRRRVLSFTLLVLAIAATGATLLVDALAPCDPNAPVMSLDGSVEMSQPYATLSVLFHAVAAILFGVTAAVTSSNRRVLAGLGVWLASGLIIEFLSTAVWHQNCPPP